jgi:glutathione peroxidase
VTFDLFDKVEVNGENACDLYKFLTSLDTQPKGAGKIGWNFEKFLIDRNGMVVARFGSSTRPDAPEVVAIIERELAKAAALGGEPQKPVAR